jgi:hypothetical protein
MILWVNMYLKCKIGLKTWKPVKLNLTHAKSIKLVTSVNLVRFYEFTKFMIWTKLGPNLTLKCLLASFVTLDTYFSNRIFDRAEILQGYIRHMKIYCDKFLGQMKFGNKIFQRVKVSRQILSNMSN